MQSCCHGDGWMVKKRGGVPAWRSHTCLSPPITMATAAFFIFHGIDFLFHCIDFWFFLVFELSLLYLAFCSARYVFRFIKQNLWWMKFKHYNFTNLILSNNNCILSNYNGILSNYNGIPYHFNWILYYFNWISVSPIIIG